MPTNNPITVPAGFAPAFALGFSDQAGALSVVEAGNPLPVSLSSDIPAVPIEGTAIGNTLVGPFVPVSGRPVILTLSGTWSGTVQVERSVNGGATRHTLTAGGATWGNYVTNACEPIWSEAESGAALFLNITITSGTLSYRMAQ